MGEADSEPSKKDDDDQSPPWDADDEKSNFKKPNNPNRTGQDSARALAQRGMQSKMNVQELAEFVHTFYDRESGTFPKGPEGVAIMVGKKFGEQAENVARKMVERMAPQQQAPELSELSRIRELARVSEGPLDKLKAAGKAAGSAIAGAATGVKKFFHKTAQHAVDEYMEKKYPGKEADTPQKKDAALALYLIDKGTLERADLDKLKPILAKAGTGLFELCMDLKIDFNQENAGGRLLKIIYPDGMTKKDADGNITSFMMKPNEDVQEGPNELSRIRELSGISQGIGM
jgi:hypothetical protein